MKNTGHVLLINNINGNPHIFLIQEKNKMWGIFGGGQEELDNNSLTQTAVRELEEESLGSLQGNPALFKFLDYYSLKGPDGLTNHKTFIAVDSRIKGEDIIVDHPDAPNKGFGDIRNGQFFPLYLVLDAIYSGKKFIIYNNEEYKLRYFFAEAIRRNREFLYRVFERQNINAMEARLRLLNIAPVVSIKSAVVSSDRK